MHPAGEQPAMRLDPRRAGKDDLVVAVSDLQALVRSLQDRIAEGLVDREIVRRLREEGRAHIPRTGSTEPIVLEQIHAKLKAVRAWLETLGVENPG